MSQVVGNDFVNGNLGFIGTCKDRLYKLTPPYTYESEKGSNITLNNAISSNIKKFVLHGKTTQTKTTGKNLLRPELYNSGSFYSKHQLTVEFFKDGCIKISGALDESIEGYVYTLYVGDYIDLLEDGQTYVTNESIRVKNHDGSIDYFKSITVNKSKMSNVEIYIQRNKTTYVSDSVIYPMLIKGTRAEISNTPWEPYTGGQPSPSIDYPQEIVSACSDGDVTIRVSDGGENAQTVSIPVPVAGLNGLKTDRDYYNYVDNNGQKWITNTIEFNSDGTSRYIERIKKQSAKDLFWAIPPQGNIAEGYILFGSSSNFAVSELRSDYFTFYGIKKNETIENSLYINKYNGNPMIVVSKETASTVQEWMALLESKNIQLLSCLEEPIITELDAETTEKLRQLYTYPTTVIENDEGCEMEIVYKRKI